MNESSAIVNESPAPARRPMRGFLRSGAAAVALAALLCACSESDDGALQKVNGSVHVSAGQPPGPAETVNGNVDVAEGAAVTSANTVNGSVRLGAHATADNVSTVNGKVSLDAGARVNERVQSVNGEITLAAGAQVTGALGNVNGRISLTAAHVGGGIRTVNGSIAIVDGSHVEGGIVVEKASGQFLNFGSDVPRIEVGPGSVVQGTLRFEREVKLYVSDRATVGPIEGTTAIPFKGDRPPAD